MSPSVDRGEIGKALAVLQADIRNPAKNREVMVRSDKGTYSFQYATLASILDGVRPLFAANGLSLHQSVTYVGERQIMRSTLLHESGETIEVDTPLVIERGGNQAIGSAITYARRYGLAMILGIAADDDDDANGADGNGARSRDLVPDPTKPAGRYAIVADLFRQRYGAPKAEQELDKIKARFSDKMDALAEMEEQARLWASE